jgi:hypothetical protein
MHYTHMRTILDKIRHINFKIVTSFDYFMDVVKKLKHY